MKKLITNIILLSYTICFSQIHQEEILIKNDSIELSGTLSFKEQNTPLVIWIHGSGSIDRNGNSIPSMMKINYIKDIGTQLNNQNIAFFSFDKRTANPKNFNYLKNTVLEDFVIDTQKIVSFFKNDGRFSNIILIGHSQGSLVGMLAAAKNVDKYISLAGPSDSIDKIMVAQFLQQNPLIVKPLKEHFEELKKTDTIKKINPMLHFLFGNNNYRFVKSWVHYHPFDEIKKLTIPILILNGTKDLQIPVKQALKLHQATPTASLVIIKNMNHVLKNIVKDEDNIKSYFSSEYPISNELITTIVDFIKK